MSNEDIPLFLLLIILFPIIFGGLAIYFISKVLKNRRK